jgi:hypothetical protein
MLLEDASGVLTGTSDAGILDQSERGSGGQRCVRPAGRDTVRLYDGDPHRQLELTSPHTALHPLRAIHSELFNARQSQFRKLFSLALI